MTLAGLLACPGAQLEVLGETGTVNISDSKATGLTSTFYSDTVGWIFAFVAIAAYAAFALVANGMDLLALESAVKFMVTCAVLLVAVTIDAIARKQRQAVGRV